MKNQWTRREFLKLAGITGFASVVPACAHRMTAMEDIVREMPVANAWNPHVASAWLPKGEVAKAYSLFKKTVEMATDFSWLTKGDSVLIKLTLNSGNPYPATTDPWSLASMIRLLKEKGAGRIMVGDSCGVEQVHWTRGKKKGASRICCEQAGLLGVIVDNHVEPVFFEELGYDAFIPEYPNGKHHWKEPVMVTTAINDADHLIYLARVSSHVMGDITSGFKTSVGFIREDSRKIFHRGGDDFYAMYEEINQLPSIVSKLRLTVSSGRKVLATFGPDKGHVAEPDLGLVLASTDLFAHEMLSYAWLLYNREFETDFFDRGLTGGLHKRRSGINRGFVWLTWDDGGFFKTPAMPVFIPGSIFAHPSAVNYMKRKGGRPAAFEWEQVNRPSGSDSMLNYMAEKLNV